MFQCQPQKTVHLNLTEDCMNHFQKNVEKLCKAEQVCFMLSHMYGQNATVVLYMSLLCDLVLSE